MKRIIADHIQANKKMYLFLAMMFALGIFIGTVVIIYLDKSVHDRLIKDLSSLFSNALQIEKDFSRVEYFRMNAVTEIKEYFVIWLCGITVLGFAAGPFFAVFKGFILGFANSFLIMNCQLRGFFYDLLTILPQNIIKIPALLFACSSIISYSIKLTEKTGIGKKVSSGNLFLLYSFSIVCAFFASMIGVIFESFITPSLIFVLAPEMLQ